MRIAAAILSLALFVFIMSGGVLYTFNQTKLYQASGILEVIDPSPVPALEIENLLEDELETTRSKPERSNAEVSIREEEDLQTQLVVMRSNQMVFDVDQRLQGDERNRFMMPYTEALSVSGPLTPVEILSKNMTVERLDHSRTFRFSYVHPDPIMAARITNLFMEAYISQQLTATIDSYMKMTEDLRIRLNQLDERIAEIKNAPTDGSGSLDLEVLLKFRSKIATALEEAKLRVNISNPEARIIDSAFPPSPNKPYKPNVMQNLAMTFSAAFVISATCFMVGVMLAPNTTRN